MERRSYVGYMPKKIKQHQTEVLGSNSCSITFQMLKVEPEVICTGFMSAELC